MEQQQDIMPPSTPLSLKAKGFDRLIGLFLLGAAGLLVAGWFLPLMTVERFWFFTDRISLFDAAWQLLENGEYILFAVIVLFSSVFPVSKIFMALLLWSFLDIKSRSYLKTVRTIENLGKWSMVDVFVIALSVVAIKISIVSDVVIHAGIYFFASAVLLSMITLWRLHNLAIRHAPAWYRLNPKNEAE